MKKVLIGILFVIGLIGYTKLIWQSGFDQGADVALCVVESMIEADNPNPVDLAKSETCQRAKDYQKNPLWQLRRRNGLEGQEISSIPDEKGLVSNIT